MEDESQKINVDVSGIQQSVKTIVVDTLGENLDAVYKKVIDKEIMSITNDKKALEQVLKKIKNLVALFIDKRKAEIIFQETTKMYDSLI